MPISQEIATSVIQAQPFSVLLQAHVSVFQANFAEIRLPITDQIKQQNGFVHGGVISYAADNALTFAGGSVLGPAVVTSEFKINYVRPAIGRELIARATVLHAGKTQAVCQCQVYARGDTEESLCAVALGTIVLLGTSK